MTSLILLPPPDWPALQRAAAVFQAAPSAQSESVLAAALRSSCERAELLSLCATVLSGNRSRPKMGLRCARHGMWQVLVGGGTTGMENRLSYYAADGAVRAADYRRMDGSPTGTGPNRFVFEEYRYDAYGRRVWVRARRGCDGISANEQEEIGECRTDLVRRTVWDGFQELVEIQQPDSSENDTTTLHRSAPDGIDQNPFIGRVLYTYGNVLDQPLSLIRVAYADSFPYLGTPQPWVMWQPFSFLPLWNHLGEVDRAMFGAGAASCQTVNGVQRCVKVAWPFGWSALQVPEYIPNYWHGTVTENRRDKAQTLYRRYRVYDPLTGRFTQEDPIGLAGGLNLYGFAGGDPVNFSDPFGLCPWCVLYAIFEVGSTLYDVGDLTITGIKYATGRASGRELAVTAGGAALGLFAFGGGYGTAARGLVKSLDDLSTAARVANRGGLSAAGRALTKHARGQRAGSQLFPELSGNVDDINRAAGEIVDDILTNPKSTASTITRGRFKGGVKVYDPSGRGLVYDAKGNFITFAER